MDSSAPPIPRRRLLRPTLVNGARAHKPRKHTIVVQPAKRLSVR